METQTWFHVKTWDRLNIERVEVEKFTDSSVWINGRKRTRRFSNWGDYFPTFDEAQKGLLRRIENELRSVREREDKLVAELGVASKLTEDDATG